MKHILLSFFISTSAFSQTIWAPAKAYWKYQASSFGSTSVIEIFAIDSILKETNIKVLKRVFTTVSYLDKTTKTTTDYIFTYSTGDKIYLGSTPDNISLYYDFGIPKGGKAGIYDVDSVFSYNVSCSGLRAYNATKIGQCTKSKINYGTCIERLGNLRGMFFPWVTDCMVSEAYSGLVEYSDGTGLHYFDGKFTCSNPTGIVFNSLNNQISVSPNPTSSSTRIDVPLEGIVDYELRNGEGLLVEKGNFTKNLELKMPNAGLFFIILSQNNKIWGSHRLIKN